MRASKPTIRIYLVLTALICIGLVLGGKLYQVQVVRGEEYSAQANEQYVRPNHNLYNRGDIHFRSRNGDRIPAATLKTGFTLAISPDDVSDPEYAYEKIQEHILINRDEFIAKANKKDDPYEVVAREVNAETAERIRDLELSGVRMYKQNWRYYPGATMAARSIGFVAYKGNNRAGRYGLERYYENVLKRDNDQVYVNFYAEVFSNIKDTLFHSGERRGDVITGIEPNVQTFLQRKLRSINEKWSSEFSGGIVVDPMTGQVLAIGSEPTFNPNELSEVATSDIFRNPLVENVYEMGSVVKPITMAIGLDEGSVTPRSTYYDKGYIELDGYRIENYDGEARGTVQMQEVLNQSLNTGAAYVADAVGHKRFAERMLDFGIGERSGVDLPNEARGLVKNLQSPRRIEHATASFGQGIAMSPISTVRALATLANGGRLVTPHLAQTIEYQNGETEKVSSGGGKRVLATSTSETITRMLVDVVDEALKNGNVAMDNYSIAAKTGTAQISMDTERGYHDDRFLHSFFGYAPAYEPRFLVFLYAIEPQAKYASQTLTDPFMDITKFLINYYQVPPDR